MEKLLSFKCICYLKQSIYFSDVFLKIPMAFLRRSFFKKNSKFIWNHKRPRIVKSNQGKGEGRFQHPNVCFKPVYKTTIIKTARYWHTNQHSNQWSRLQKPEISQLIFERNSQTMRKRAILSINDAGKSGHIHSRRKLDSYLPLYMSNNLRWIEEINIIPETMKLKLLE